MARTVGLVPAGVGARCNGTRPGTTSATLTAPSVRAARGPVRRSLSSAASARASCWLAMPARMAYRYPPNGWGCQCSVRGLWARDLKKLGKDAPDEAPEVNWLDREVGQRSPEGPQVVRVPEGIDPGFAYAPGAARLKSAIPPERPDLPGSMGAASLPTRPPSDALPAPRDFSASELLAPGRPEQDYVRDFLSRFGATLEEPAVFTDVIGERLVVGSELFQRPDGRWKALKRERAPFMPMLAQALVDPDEIWARLEWHEASQKAVVRRRYIARFLIDGQELPALLVFEIGADGWAGTTTFQGQTQTADNWRSGVRLYRRP